MGQPAWRHIEIPSFVEQQLPSGHSQSMTWPQAMTCPHELVGHAGVSSQQTLSRQLSPLPHPPHSIVPPQPSGRVPQAPSGHVRGAQQTPPLAHTSPLPQPQDTSPPAPSGKVPHSKPPPVNSEQRRGLYPSHRFSRHSSRPEHPPHSTDVSQTATVPHSAAIPLSVSSWQDPVWQGSAPHWPLEQ